MYSDPQTLTVNAVAQTLSRVGATPPDTRGTLRTPTGDYTLDVRQNVTSNRFRREARFSFKKIAANALTTQLEEVSTSIIVAVDEPRVGFTDAELTDLYSALAAWLSSSTNANFKKLLGGEL